jgi:hypothetical protein
VSSTALTTWRTTAKTSLDEIAAAHAAVGGRSRGRRYATQEINHAYAVLLSSQFQRFCRDLHTEAAAHIVDAVAPAALRPVVRARMLEGRKLDRGNANPGNLGADFGRFGFDFWARVRASDARNERRQAALRNLAAWRNAIAHQDFDPALTPPPPLHLSAVRAWRSACGSLAVEFDHVVAERVTVLVGARPW